MNKENVVLPPLWEKKKQVIKNNSLNESEINKEDQIPPEKENEFFFVDSNGKRTGNKKIKIEDTILRLIKNEDGSSGIDIGNYALGNPQELKTMIKLGGHYFWFAFGLATFLTIINVFGFIKIYDLTGWLKDMPAGRYISAFFMSMTLEYMILYSGLMGMEDMFENSKLSSKIMGTIAFIPFAIEKTTSAVSNADKFFDKVFLEPFFLGLIFTSIGIAFSTRVPDYISECVKKIREIYFYKILKH